MKAIVKTRKAQSAMEYLMTYGWAILIIAVVLGALFSLGVFSSSNLLGTFCAAYSGFECINPLLHTGTFTATVGQSTGTSWTTANILFAAQGAGTPTTASFGAGSCAQQFTSGFSNGQTQSVSITCELTAQPSTTGTFTSSVGTAYAGSLWACYAISGSVCTYIVQVATLNVKST